MREILFRGKQIEGKWVEGVYFKHDTIKVCFSSDDPKPRHLIIQDGFCDWGFEPPIHCVDVDPETVGQFTGLTDKNGKKIFEGDILRFMAYGIEYTGKVEFLNGAFWVKCRFHDRIGAIVYEYKPEIIGNIHDNPELVEVD